MKRFALPAAAILLLAGCAGEPLPEDLAPASPPMFAEPGEGESEAIGLVNLWRVSDAQGETESTWLRLDAHEFQLWRDCGMIMGSWRASDSLFLASVHAASGDCATGGLPAVAWLESASAFTETADGYELLSDGVTVATLTVDGAPQPIDTAAEFYTKPPEVTEDVRARFRAAASLPRELTPVSADALAGKWIPAGGSIAADPHVVFAGDGTWSGSDGCNGGGGRWAADGGEFLATSGPSTLIYCDGAAVPSWVSQASAAGVDADGHLHLFDASGAPLGILSR
jgi:hypothetical protein